MSNFFIKILCTSFIVLINTYTAKAKDLKTKTFGDVYVMVKVDKAKLSQIFDLIEKQTAY
jgi:hypothetical protein